MKLFPQLSEQALAEAGQPLDDLEEHRRNAADLERASQAIEALLDVYRAYCSDELRQRAAEGRSRLSSARGRTRDEKHKRRAAVAAEAEVVRLDEAIDEQVRTAVRLRSEISALDESRAYREGRQLDALRDFVANLARRRENFAVRVAGREERLEAAAGELQQARERGRSDAAALNVGLAAAAELSEHCHIGHHPPGPVALTEIALANAEASEPGNAFDNSAMLREINATSGAVLARQTDIDDVDRARAALDEAENALSLAESRYKDASDAADRCSGRLAEQDQRLVAARRLWHDDTQLWISEATPALRTAGLDTLVPAEPGADEPPADDSQATETPRIELLSACEELIGHWRESAAAVEFRLSGERAAASEAQALVDALTDRTEPKPPRLGWQIEADYCLADLIDFKSHLGETERSGIEAALESSGLLSARLLDGGGLELASKAATGLRLRMTRSG